MATPIEKFRSAINGFNRTDVVQFIQRQTAEHEKALRQAREENNRNSRGTAELREQITALKAELETVKAEKAALAAENERLLAAQKALQAELSAKESYASATEVVSEAELDRAFAPVAIPSDFNEMELAAYRRAEQTERMARDRAAASAERMKRIFDQADSKLSLTTTELTAAMETCRSDFEQMQNILSAARTALGESSESLKAAAELCEN